MYKFTFIFSVGCRRVLGGTGDPPGKHNLGGAFCGVQDHRGTRMVDTSSGKTTRPWNALSQRIFGKKIIQNIQIHGLKIQNILLCSVSFFIFFKYDGANYGNGACLPDTCTNMDARYYFRESKLCS